MNILFLLSSLEPAGSETYCLTLARAWEKQHVIFWISDRLHFGQSYTVMPISQKAIPGGLLNTVRVLHFVRTHRIDIIHSHSRRAHWVGAQVSALTGIPHVTTIHQPPPVHLFSRLFPCLGDHAIAIDEVVADHLKHHFGRTETNVSLIRNGIDLDYYGGQRLPSNAPEYHAKRILVLGRMTGGRWKVVQFLLAGLYRFGSTLPKTQYRMIGRIPEDRQPLLQKKIAELNSLLSPSSIELTGFVSDIRPFLEECDGAIAGGRSAMETMAFGKPVVMIGEGGIIGMSSPETLSEALRTNFGDHVLGDQFIPAKLEVALRELLDDKTPFPDRSGWCRQQMETYYDSQSIAKEINKVYENLLHKRRKI